MDFGKIFMRRGILLGHFLCDRVQGVERFATHPRHFPSQVPPLRDRQSACFEFIGSLTLRVLTSSVTVLATTLRPSEVPRLQRVAK